MFNVPNGLWRRVGHYFGEDDWVDKRWTWKRLGENYALAFGITGGVSPVRYTTIPADPTGGVAKAESPEWRLSRWILLESTGDRVCYPFFFRDVRDAWGMRKMFRLTTRHFAVRVGDSPFQLTTFDMDGQCHAPEIVRHREQIVIGTPDELISIHSNYHEPTTKPITFC